MSAAGLHHRRQPPSGDPSSEIQPVEEGEGRENGAAAPKPGSSARRQGGSWRDGIPCAPAAGAAALAAAAILAAVYLLIPLLHSSGGTSVSLAQAGLFTPEQLARFDGRRGRRVYLAVLGSVFDVTPGARHYGPEGGYLRFAGRDASRSYVTGRFAEDAHDDVADFSGEQAAELLRWREFYATHKEYRRVGRVVGRFYDPQGQPTPLLARMEAAAAAHAAAKEAAEQGGGQTQQQQEPCNVRWSKAEGGSVWCDGGRFPRRVLQPDWQGRLQERCGCVEEREASGTARLYDGCPPDASRCATSPPDPAA